MRDWHGWRGNVVCQTTKYSMIVVLVHSNITLLSSWPDWKTQTWYSISWFVSVRNMRVLRVRHINFQTLYEQKWDISRMHFEILTLNRFFTWTLQFFGFPSNLKQVTLSMQRCGLIDDFDDIITLIFCDYNFFITIDHV